MTSRSRFKRWTNKRAWNKALPDFAKILRQLPAIFTVYAGFSFCLKKTLQWLHSFKTTMKKTNRTVKIAQCYFNAGYFNVFQLCSTHPFNWQKQKSPQVTHLWSCPKVRKFLQFFFTIHAIGRAWRPWKAVACYGIGSHWCTWRRY